MICGGNCLKFVQPALARPAVPSYINVIPTVGSHLVLRAACDR
jgi:hypothetical protein